VALHPKCNFFQWMLIILKHFESGRNYSNTHMVCRGLLHSRNRASPFGGGHWGQPGGTD
jgi:hypothetical protein